MHIVFLLSAVSALELPVSEIHYYCYHHHHHRILRAAGEPVSDYGKPF